MKHKAILTMKDGTETATLPTKTEQETINKVKELLNTTTRYYKKDGEDFGINGKLFTFKEEHNGIEKITLYKIETTPLKDITKIDL